MSAQPGQDPFATEHGLMRVTADALSRIAATAASLTARGEHEDAALFVQAGAGIAWRNQPGAFSLPELDAVAADIADAALAPWSRVRPANRGRERVLHVLTEVYATGGHTRLASRWMSRDRRRDHTVVLTRQTGVPAKVLAAFQEAGADVKSLGSGTVPVLDRAAALRALASAFDIVVLHVHPDDAAAVIAMQPGPDRPPTLFMNHADVATWLGASAFDVLVGFRKSAAILDDLRGIAPERRARVPLPCDPPADLQSRADARAQLGLPQDAEVILTVGQRGKYAPLNDHVLSVALLPTLHARPHAHVVAVGPLEEHTPWTEVVPLADGRLHLVGPKSEILPYYAAADVLLESFPVGGGTVVMEAALAGLPVVSFQPTPMAHGLFWQEPIGDPDPRLHGATGDQLAQHFATLFEDPAEADRRAHALGAATLALHSGDGWIEQLEAAYRLASELSGGRGPAWTPPPLLDPADDTFPLLLRYNFCGGGASPPEAVHASSRALAMAANSPAIRERLPTPLGEEALPLPAPFDGVLAAPELDEDEIAELLAEMRELRAAGAADRFSIALPRAELDRAVALVEPVLAAQDASAGWELDVDVLVHDDAGPSLTAGWLALAARDDARGWWGDAPIHRPHDVTVHV